MNKVYIAASYTAHALAEEVAGILAPYCEVVSTWHKPQNVVDDDNFDDEAKETRADTDMQQIKDCDWLIYLSTPHPSRGGRDFEMGYATALGKKIFVFRGGGHTHIFAPLLNKPIALLIDTLVGQENVRNAVHYAMYRHTPK